MQLKIKLNKRRYQLPTVVVFAFKNTAGPQAVFKEKVEDGKDFCSI
ncbi:hypothetical protein BH10BAC3_BH10BAC3_01030 [soil metagenome]